MSIIQASMFNVGPRANSVSLITTSGAGSIVSPYGYRYVSVEAIGGGGNGFAGNTAQRASAGGGAYAKTANLLIPYGTTIYYSVGAAAADSWVNISANSAPASTTAGCLAKAGGSASSGVAGTAGSDTASIGTTKFAGGAGATGSAAGGGGAAGDSAAGTSGTASTNGTGGTGTNLTGGNGGAYIAAGTAPGGGGGSDSNTGINQPGGIGRVRITFSQFPI